MYGAGVYSIALLKPLSSVILEWNFAFIFEMFRKIKNLQKLTKIFTFSTKIKKIWDRNFKISGSKLVAKILQIIMQKTQSIQKLTLNIESFWLKYSPITRNPGSNFSSTSDSTFMSKWLHFFFQWARAAQHNIPPGKLEQEQLDTIFLKINYGKSSSIPYSSSKSSSIPYSSR